jgi:hypothetical protein
VTEGLAADVCDAAADLVGVPLLLPATEALTLLVTEGLTAADCT